MHTLSDIVRSALALAGGIALVLAAINSALRTFVLARSARDPLTGLVFKAWRKLFNLRAAKATTYAARDQIMGLYAPTALLSLPIVWLAMTTAGYTLIYYAMGVEPLYDAYTLSGSALTTLGFARHDGWLFMTVIFSEAATGLIMVALLISYLPTMYSAFSTRETAVTMLEVRAGSPPSAVTLIDRANRIRGLDVLPELFAEWETWFSAIEESHTTLAPLVFFRSPKPERHWVTAAGAVLDAAALYAAAVDQPRNPQAALCLRAGYLALRSVADFFEIDYNPAPAPDDPISISRSEFDDAVAQLIASGVTVKADREQAWRDFAGWRVNYDLVLLKIAALTMAPYAPWVSDRSLPGMGRVTGRA